MHNCYLQLVFKTGVEQLQFFKTIYTIDFAHVPVFSLGLFVVVQHHQVHCLHHQ